MKNISASLGIMAYNEEKNIGRFLDSLFSQKNVAQLISEVIIVSSGSTDRTNKVVRQYMKKYRKIKLLRETKRNGKAAAVNRFIAYAKKDILILSSADILLEKQSISSLLKPFQKREIGITGAHPIPLNNKKTFMGFAAHLLWNLHHEMSLHSPKMGEMIAFRKVFKKIPILSSVDEANIEPLVRGQGYKAIYVPNAIIYNKGPETIKEFITRRRHIYFGHLSTKYEYSYEVSTISSIKVLMLLLKNMKLNIRYILYTPFVVLLEGYSRLLGYLDYKFKIKSHTIWEVTPSTKDLRAFQ